MLTFAFKIIRHLLSLFFFFFCSQKRKFSIIKKLFHNQRTFPQSSKFSTIQEFFHSQETFLESYKFSTVKEIFHIKSFFDQGNFSTKRSNFTKNFFFVQRSFPQTNIFLEVKTVFCKERSKMFSTC